MSGEATQLQPEKTCEEKVRLMDEYASATAEFSRTLNILNAKTGVLSKTEYDSIREFVDVARKRSEAARVALVGHIAKHGC